MSSPTTKMPTDMTVIDDTAPSEAPSTDALTLEVYQETLLGAAIKAATLLDELMGLSIIPDPRVKDAADVALQLVAIMKDQVSAAANIHSTSGQNVQSTDVQSADKNGSAKKAKAS